MVSPCNSRGQFFQSSLRAHEFLCVEKEDMVEHLAAARQDFAGLRRNPGKFLHQVPLPRSPLRQVTCQRQPVLCMLRVGSWKADQVLEFLLKALVSCQLWRINLEVHHFMAFMPGLFSSSFHFIKDNLKGINSSS